MLKVDGFVMCHHPVRSDSSLKRKIKNVLLILWKPEIEVRSLQGFSRKCKENFLKITTLLDTMNSKNSKRILFIVLEPYWSCPKACVFSL